MQERQPDARQNASLIDSIQAVLRLPVPGPGRPGLPAEACKAFIALALSAGGVRRSWVTHAGVLGAAIGTSETSGRRLLKTLEDYGLVEINRYKGDVSVFLKDPQEVARARRTRAASDRDQGELDFPADPNSPSEEAGGAEESATVPLPSAHPKTAGLALDPPVATSNISLERDVRTSNIKHLSRDQDVSCSGGGSRAIPAAKLDPRKEAEAIGRIGKMRQDPDPPKLGAAIDEAMGAMALAASVAPTRKIERAAQWLKLIHDQVGDPLLGKNQDGSPSRAAEGLLRHVAWHLAEGLCPAKLLHDSIAELNWRWRRGRVTSTRAAYWMGIVRRMFLAQEPPLPWPLRGAAHVQQSQLG